MPNIESVTDWRASRAKGLSKDSLFRQMVHHFLALLEELVAVLALDLLPVDVGHAALGALLARSRGLIGSQDVEVDVLSEAVEGGELERHR